jgi:chemotaxis protein histidine kinase CheA
MNLDVCIGADKECGICGSTDTPDDPMIVLQCEYTNDENKNRHCFHIRCIKKWVTIGQPTCPICREEIALETRVRLLEPERNLIVDINKQYQSWYLNCINKFLSLSDAFMKFQLTKSISIKEILKKKSFSKKVSTYVSKVIKQKTIEKDMKKDIEKAKQEYDNAKQKYLEAKKQIDSIDIPEWLLPLYNYYKLLMNLHYNVSIAFFYYLADIIDYDIYTVLQKDDISIMDNNRKYQQLKHKNLIKVFVRVPELLEVAETLLKFIEKFAFIEYPIEHQGPELTILISSATKTIVTTRTSMAKIPMDLNLYIFDILKHSTPWLIIKSGDSKKHPQEIEYTNDNVKKIIDFIEKTNKMDREQAGKARHEPHLKKIMKYISHLYGVSDVRRVRNYKDSVSAALAALEVANAAAAAEEKIAEEAAEDDNEEAAEESLRLERQEREIAELEELAYEEEEEDASEEEEEDSVEEEDALLAAALRIKRRTAKRQHAKKSSVKRQHAKKRSTRRQRAIR